MQKEEAISKALSSCKWDVKDYLPNIDQGVCDFAGCFLPMAGVGWYSENWREETTDKTNKMTIRLIRTYFIKNFFTDFSNPKNLLLFLIQH